MRFINAILVIIISLNGYNFGSAKPSLETDIEKVKLAIADFNKLLFEDSDGLGAFREHFFIGHIDATDRKFGLEDYFLNATEGIPPKDKLSFFSEYLDSGLFIQLIKWHLGHSLLTEDTVLDDSEIAADKEFVTLFQNHLTQLGLTEESLDRVGNLNHSNLPFHEKFTEALSKAINEKANRETLRSNILFLNKQTNLTCEIVESRKYFLASNKIFVYKVSIKDGEAKIMEIRRNFGK